MLLSRWSLRGRAGLSWRGQLSLSWPTGPRPLLYPGLTFVSERLLVGAVYHTGSLASLPSFVLAFLSRIPLSPSKPSLCVASFSVLLKLSVSTGLLFSLSILLPSAGPPTPRWSLLPASFCLWQPQRSTGQCGRLKPLEPGLYLQGGLLDVSRVRMVQPGPCGSPSCLRNGAS